MDLNTGLARLAGELCQGYHVHPLHSADYLREVVRPALAVGAARSGRTLADIQAAILRRRSCSRYCRRCNS